jgi:GTP-binding protein
LGVRFLKHLERVAALCHLVEPPIDELAMSEEEGRVEGSRPLFRYRALRKELEQYSEELAWVPEVVVITKMDLFEAELDGQAPKEHPEIAPLIDELHRENRALFFMSSVAHDGLDPVKFALLKRIEAESPEAKEKKEKKPFDPLAKDKLR